MHRVSTKNAHNAFFDILDFTGKDLFAVSARIQYLCGTYFKNRIIMARPIKPTPILYGKDAIRFEEKMRNPTPISQEEREEMKKAYQWAKERAVNFKLG
jgi:hypothetical protein